MNSRHAMRSLISGALQTIVAIPLAFAEGSFDLPAGAHFNLQKLQRVGEYLREQIANGKIPGAIVLIRQHDKPVYHEFFGVRDVATKLPMTDDTIFRLFSMTKPITSVAAMMLVDKGKLRLNDPVAKYIPSFSAAKVGVEKKAANGDRTLDLVPANRPITIVDLMTHTSGLPMVFTARAWFGNFIATPKSMTAISTTPNSPNASPGFHWRYSPVRNGTTATRLTFLGALSKSCRENRCCSSRKTICLARSA